MAFLATVTNDRRYVLKYQYVGCTGKLVQSFGWATVGREYTGHYAIEHRTKPKDLLSSLTARPRATSENWSATKLRRFSTLGCSDGPHEKVSYSYSAPWRFPMDPGDLAPSINTDLRLKIKEISYNMAETIGEYRESVDMVTGAGQKVFSEARRVYKRLPRKIRRKLSILDVPAYYLLASFGLVPTLATVHDAMMALNASATQPLRRRVIVTRKAVRSRTFQDGLQLGSARCEEWESRRGIFYVTYDPASINALTAGNPAEAIWAAVPFSWVVDYFITVGSWLSSLDACKGVRSVMGTETLKSGHRFVDNRVTTSATGWHVERPGMGYRSCYTRTVHSSIPVDLTPEWRPSGSFRKLSYLLAIAAGFKR